MPGQCWPALAYRHHTFLEDDEPPSRRARLDQANGIIERLDWLAFRATATRPDTIASA
jgi:hypothetical protein